jgi:hypothetical protein
VRSPAALIVLLAGCSTVSAGEQAILATQPGSERVRLVALDGCCAVITAAPTRGQLDVFTPRAREVGSFLSGSVAPTDVIVASVGGRPAFLVLGDGREVTLLTNDLVDPHRLRRPNGIYEGGDVGAIAAGDLDGDGMDELVVGTGGGVRLVDDLERALFADPEEVPSLDAADLPGGTAARALAVADLTGDGLPDVVAASGSSLRIWDAPGYDRADGGRTTDVELGASAVELRATRCDGGAVFARLEDGRVVRIQAGGATDELPVAPGVMCIATSDDALVVAHDDGDLAIFDACGTESGVIGTGHGVRDVAITRRLPGGRRLAVLRDDRETVALYEVSASF